MEYAAAVGRIPCCLASSTIAFFSIIVYALYFPRTVGNDEGSVLASRSHGTPVVKLSIFDCVAVDCVCDVIASAVITPQTLVG